MSKMLRRLAAAFFLLAAAPPRTTIFIASDSTAQDYKPAHYPQSGWGTMLRCAVGPGVTVENRAIGGRSSRSFIAQGRLAEIAKDIRPGDTLLVQFGHNDASIDKPERYTPVPAYAENLKRFVAVAREAGAQPVILTPVTRRSFEGARIKPSFPEYSAAARRVARETKTPLIDLDTLSARWLERVGVEPSRALFMAAINEDTHFSELGARGVADIVAGGLAEARLPISRRILRDRPSLRRTAPLGGPDCR